MANLSQRDKTLLGFSPRDPFGASSPNSPQRTSDIDFNDVFGGPPRRSSLSEPRRSRGDSLDSYSSRERGSGSGLGERPVFGEFGSPARRRHLKDDFFSDIFESSDSSCSSQRKLERDPLGSSPGSRILSPVRSVAPVICEPVAGGSSLPAQLSPSMKLAKGMDYPTFSSSASRARSSDSYSSPSSPSASVPSLTTRASPSLDDLKIDGHTLYRQSPLSRQVSRCLDKSLEIADSASLSTGSHSQKDPASLEGYVRNGQFHFSIYKWAGKGVTLIMPSHLNSCSKYESRLRRLPEIVLQEADLTLHKDNIPVVMAFKSESDSKDNESETDLIAEKKDYADLTIVNDLSPAELEPNFLQSDANKNSDTCNKHSEEVPVTLHEAQKHASTNLSQLFDVDLDKERNEDIIRQAEEAEGLFRSQQSVHDDMNIKKQVERENNRNPVSAVSPTMQGKVRGNKVKGKVKDFIKIFNQEGLPKRKGTFETLDRRSREKDGRKSRIIDQVSYPAAKVDEEVKTACMNTSSKLSDSPIPIGQNIEDAETENSNIIYDVHMIDDSLSERNEPLRQCSDSTPDNLGASVCSAEESLSEDLDGCLVEEISLDQNKKTDSLQDQIKTIDTKIRDWSKGKEGNIRSLLSTLQYVLWPESGWKPVPLVDIIEGSSVKRAYQKALLCLHPDKLQQKGASLHQKHTAEKVFDILQEAWIHFNSISQF